jgi:hypothetical protein
MAKTNHRAPILDRPRDSKRDPRNRQRDAARKSARRAKYTIQGRTSR